MAADLGFTLPTPSSQETQASEIMFVSTWSTRCPELSTVSLESLRGAVGSLLWLIRCAVSRGPGGRRRSWDGGRCPKWGDGSLERLLACANPFRVALLLGSRQRGGGTRHDANGRQFVAQGLSSDERLRPQQVARLVGEQ